MYSIMIIDDEMAIRENLPKAFPFEEYGFRVCGTAANGEEALSRLPEIRPDLIFLDVCMPVLDGLGFLKELRHSIYKDTVVIMLSGYNDFEYARTAMRYEVKAYLTKPIDEDELFPLLEEVRKELTDIRKVKTVETIREDSSYLKKIYNCGHGDRNRLAKYMLMHIILLGMDTTFEEQHPEIVLLHCLEEELDPADHCEILSRGGIYSFLVREEALIQYQNDVGLFSKHLLYRIKQVKLEGVLLFDRVLFVKEDKSLREDYSLHLYGMLSRVFYGNRNYLEFTDSRPDKDNSRIKFGDLFLEKLRKGRFFRTFAYNSTIDITKIMVYFL